MCNIIPVETGSVLLKELKERIKGEKEQFTCIWLYNALCKKYCVNSDNEKLHNFADIFDDKLLVGFLRGKRNDMEKTVACVSLSRKL